MKRIFSRLGPAVWVPVFLLGAVLASSAIGEQLSDKAIAEEIVATAASSSAEAAVLRAPIDEAKKALQRAAGARRSGDVRHAELLEGLAREWAETARDLGRAAAVEADAGALEMAAAAAVLKAERARALLEEAISRRGRAEAELERLSVDAGPFPTKPSSTNGGRAKPGKQPGAAKGTR